MSKEKHLIDETARVFCGVRGRDVDIETCLGCRRLENYDLDARRPYVVCRASEDIEIGIPRRRDLETAV